MLTPCIEWDKGSTRAGYGVFRHPITKKNVYAHRYAWESKYGRTLTSDELVHHLCENKLCINPDHMQIVSRKNHPSLHKGEYCIRGHELTPENRIKRKNRRGECKLCHRERMSRNKLMK